MIILAYSMKEVIEALVERGIEPTFKNRAELIETVRMWTQNNESASRLLDEAADVMQEDQDG